MRALAVCLAIGFGFVMAACSTGATSPAAARLGATTEEFLVPPNPANPKAYAYVTLSVADMDQALGLWVQRFGMQIVVRRQGTDPGLARLWGVAADAIIDQALLLTPGMQQGGVHLVRFRMPGAAVREGASTTDLVPKSVDIAVRDISARYAELESAGYRFRSPIGRFETDGVIVDEVHLPGPDGVNLVFLEQQGKPEPVSPEGYGVAPQIVAISPDNTREKLFFETVLGLDETSYHRFAGAAVEQTIGLPAGGALDVRIFGDRGYDYGRLEIVQYEGVKSADLYPRAKAPARGLLSVTFFVTDLAAVLERAAVLQRTAGAMRAAPVDHGVVSSVFGTARMATLTSPAGLRIDLLERR
ncbi:MAG: VOC family protein [Sinobacteraceae bacterium]|nr:VOC family protein [Nevskiaceae bacterium]